MKRNLIHILWTAALLLTACTQEDLPGVQDGGNAQTLIITVTDGGYSSDGQQTKSTENGYRTEFTAGDACGLYIVRGGTVIHENVKLTATASADGNALTWQSEAGVKLVGGFPDESYFIYYPYQADMGGKTTVSATDADGFFAPLVSGWQPKTDQSTYADYTASDLMTAKGTAAKDGGSLKLTFSMTHRMAMAVIEMPKTVYKFTNTDVSIPDYTAASSVDFTLGSVKPYAIAPGTYRCVVNPANGAAASIIGCYDDGKKEFSVTPNGIDAGSCKTYKVDGAAQSEKQTVFQIGDYFCKDGSGNWYIIPQESNPDGNVIGIVFHTGRHATDLSDYSQPLTGNGPTIPDGVFHGYAVALTDVHNGGSDRLRWESGLNYVHDRLVDASTSESDWQGYSNSLKFHEFIGKEENKGWEMKHFPAALACETYGNRTEDREGNPTSAYDWQKPFAAPQSTSGWYLPSCAQLSDLYGNRSLLSSRMDAVRSCVPDNCDYKNHIRWFNEYASYWSSTEYDSAYAWFQTFSQNNAYALYDPKWTSGRVRAVLAF